MRKRTPRIFRKLPRLFVERDDLHLVGILLHERSQGEAKPLVLSNLRRIIAKMRVCTSVSRVHASSLTTTTLSTHPSPLARVSTAFDPSPALSRRPAPSPPFSADRLSPHSRVASSRTYAPITRINHPRRFIRINLRPSRAQPVSSHPPGLVRHRAQSHTSNQSIENLYARATRRRVRRDARPAIERARRRDSNHRAFSRVHARLTRPRTTTTRRDDVVVCRQPPRANHSFNQSRPSSRESATGRTA